MPRAEHIIRVPYSGLDLFHEWTGITNWVISKEITANEVTVFRGALSLLVVPLAWIAMYCGFTTAGIISGILAFVIFLLSWWMDALDGSVAREYLRRGFVQADPHLGPFLDPMVDKGSWMATTVAIPWGIDMMRLEGHFFVTIILAFILVIIDGDIAWIRWKDYRRSQGRGPNKVQANLNLNARLTGKTKMVLMVFGTGGWIVASFIEHDWPLYVSLATFATGIPFAIASRSMKLDERRRHTV